MRVSGEPIRLTDEQRVDWLRLIRSQNVGPRTFRALLNQFGGARPALEALPALARRGGNSTPQICSREWAEQEIEAGRKLGVTLVALGEADYPQRLQMIDDAREPTMATSGIPNTARVATKCDERWPQVVGKPVCDLHAGG